MSNIVSDREQKEYVVFSIFFKCLRENYGHPLNIFEKIRQQT